MIAAPRTRRLARAARTALLWSALGVACLPVPARSQAEFGGVRGRVTDADFDTPIPRAMVRLEPAGLSVFTGADGQFAFGELPPGVYSAVVSRDGYATARQDDIAVSAGAFSEISLSMTALVVELEDVVVSTEDLVGEGDVQALDIRLSLASFANVAGADFISKIGGDVGKTLQKTAGVSVVGGRYIVVRGLADRYNVVLLNKAGIPSSDPDRRAVNIDLFPGSIVQSLETFKTFTPDLPGEATGGTILIQTKGVPEKNFAKGKVELGYDTSATGNGKFLTYRGGGTGFLGDLANRELPQFIKQAGLSRFISNVPEEAQKELAFREKVNRALSREMGTIEASAPPNFKFEASAGARMDVWGGTAGLLLGVDYSKRYTLEQGGIEGRYEFGIDGEANFVDRLSKVDRGIETLGSSLLLVGGFQPAPDHEIKLTLFANLAADDRASFRLGPVDFLPGSAPSDSGYQEALTYTERRLQTLQLTGKHAFGGRVDLKTDWFATYNLSSQDEPDHRFIRSLYLPAENLYFAPGAIDVPLFRRYWREIDDTRYNFGVNFDFRLFGGEDADAPETRAKIGAGFDYATRDYRADSFAYNVGLNNSQGYPSFIKPEVPGETWGDQFLYGNPPLTDVPNPESANYLWRFTVPEEYEASQAIPAAYFMLTSEFSKQLKATYGIRFEQTHTRIRATDIWLYPTLDQRILFLTPEQRADPEIIADLGNATAAANNPDIVARSRLDFDEDHFLPAVTVKYDITPEMALRFAASRTIARPSFKEQAPILIRDAETAEDFIGNIDLKISNITNVDLRWEWAPAGGGLIAVSAFTKFIEDPIEKQESSGVETFINSKEAVVYGFELEYDRKLGFLARELEDFGLGLNFTYLVSKAERDDFSVFGATRRLQGQPDYLFNFNVTYDNKDYGIFAGLFLNLTGPYLDAVGAGSTPDIFVEPITTLNALLQVKVGPHSKLSFRANNLTRDRIRRVYDNGDRPVYSDIPTATVYSVSYEMEW